MSSAGAPADDRRAPTRPPGWRERWRRQRDRWLADPAFRDAAVRSSLTRPLARRRAAGVFDLMAGFVYSQVLAACVELDLFERLVRHALTPRRLAAESQLPPAAAARLLEAAAALDLVEALAAPVQDDAATADAAAAGGDIDAEYGLGVLGATFVANEALTSLVRHHATLYRDLQDPLALLRTPRGDAELARYWSYATARRPGQLAEADVATYSAVMSSSQALIAAQVLDAYPFARHRCLLDVGGGEGNFLAAALERVPTLAGQLFDLPPVAAAAERRLAARGLGERVRCHGGDFKSVDLPRGADLVSLVRVLYDHDDEPALRLLRAVREVLPPGGTVLVAEPMADARGARRMGAAYFGIYLWAMGSGRVRSAAAHKALLRAAGFEAARERHTALPLQTSVVTARAPG